MLFSLIFQKLLLLIFCHGSKKVHGCRILDKPFCKLAWAFEHDTFCASVYAVLYCNDVFYIYCLY